MKRLQRFVALAALGATMAACSPVVRIHGYAPLQEELDEIQTGVDTRGSVRRKIGRPAVTGTFDQTGWYYVASRIEHFAYEEPKVIDRRVVAITFDANDVVTGVNTYGLEDGRVVDLVTGVTPTFGSRLGVLEQLLNNIGALSADQLLNTN